MPRRLAPIVFSVVVLLGLVVYLFWVPLRPAAWGGPRGQGPFEEGELPAAGRFARDVRIHLEAAAARRSPDRPLEATAEALAGYHALLAAGRFAVLWLVLWRVGGRGWLATLGVVGAAVPMMCGAPRQDDTDVGLVLFALLMAATTPARVPWLVAIVGLPALFAFWVNAHASALVGLAWLGVVLAGRAVEWWNGRPSELAERPAVGRLFLALALCAGATCLNPDGPNYFVEAFRITKNPNIPTLPDWQPVDFSKPAGMPWGYFATLAALFLAQLASRRALGPMVLGVLLTFGFWPVLQQRGLAYWWLIAPWLAVPLVSAAAGQVSNLAGQVGNLSHKRAIRWATVGLLALVLVTTPFVRWLTIGRPRPLDSSVSADTPWRVARELTAGDDDATHLSGLRETVRAAYPNSRYRGAILAGEEQGTFLAWVLDGDNTQPVMIYLRPETIDPPHWGECQQGLEGGGNWWEVLGRHQVNLVVIDPSQRKKLAERLLQSAEWRIVEGDENAPLLVAVRREPKLPVELQQ